MNSFHVPMYTSIVHCINKKNRIPTTTKISIPTNVNYMLHITIHCRLIEISHDIAKQPWKKMNISSNPYNGE